MVKFPTAKKQPVKVTMLDGTELSGLLVGFVPVRPKGASVMKTEDGFALDVDGVRQRGMISRVQSVEELPVPELVGACSEFAGAGRRCDACRFLKHLH